MPTRNLADVFNTLNVKPAFEYSKQGNDSGVEFVHRRLQNGDIFFVDNRSDRDEAIDCHFPGGGKRARVMARRNG